MPPQRRAEFLRGVEVQVRCSLTARPITYAGAGEAGDTGASFHPVGDGAAPIRSLHRPVRPMARDGSANRSNIMRVVAEQIDGKRRQGLRPQRSPDPRGDGARDWGRVVLIGQKGPAVGWVNRLTLLR
jgi:hypothetical protein